jgi:hypothetical protein
VILGNFNSAYALISEPKRNLSMKSSLFLFGVIALVLCISACGGRLTESDDTPPFSAAALPIRVSSMNADAAEPAIAVGEDGTLYVAWVEHSGKQADVLVQRFDANGKTSRNPKRVNPQSGEATAWRGDPPTLAMSTDGTLYVEWTRTVASPSGHADDIYLSQSHDGGETFDDPVKVNDDQRPAVHGMHSLAIGSDGRIYIAWLDERNALPVPIPSSTEGHHQMEGNREVFLATSRDGGRSFGSNIPIANDACPCCKTAVAVSPDNRVYVSWRQVLPGDFRHIAIAYSDNRGETFSQPVIVSDDRWSIGGCPVSGGALSAGANGGLSVLWYTAGDAGPEGLYSSQSLDGGQTFAQRKLVYEGSVQGTPSLMGGDNNQLYAVWEGNRKGTPLGVMIEPLSNTQGHGGPVLLAALSSLPDAVMSGGQVYIVYMLDDGSKHSVMFQTALLNRQS